MTESVLVTGGAGFIGSALVRHLVGGRGIRVVNLDKLTYAGNVESLAPIAADPGHRLVEADVCDAAAVRATLERDHPDAVVHLAAESHVDRSIDGPGEFVRTNVVGTATLLAECLRYWRSLASPRRERFRFVHVSTDEVYGSLGATGRFSEASAYAPNSPYAASKAGADHMVRAWHRTYGFPAITTNCSNNYGPYQFPEKLIPLVILNALEGKPLPVYGTGDNVRDWLYVDDHVLALCRVLEAGKPGETYNVGGDAERTNMDVVRAVCANLDEIRPDSSWRPHESLVTLVEDRPGHDKRYAIDTAKISRELDWKPGESFETGLRKTVRWYVDNPSWCRHVRDGSYRGERLGLASA